MGERYTIDGSDALEAHLRATCAKVLTGVRQLIPARQLVGLLLGGGYGRGEGGVLRSPSGDLAYNDLEFYVFVRGQAVLAERKFRQPLHELGESLSPAAGLEVEFKVLTLDKLRNSPVNMFYYDLMAGHRWQLGDDSLLKGCEHHLDAGHIPLAEATRLLMNRCSGLLYSAERLARRTFGPAEADFVGRNLAKAQLAFGDVLVTAHGQYDWSCRKRHHRLTSVATSPGLTAETLSMLCTHHAAGVEFKLHPVRTEASHETLAQRHAELVALGQSLWLWLESRRLNQTFPSSVTYATSPANLCPETPGWRNRLVNFRASGPRGVLDTRYPRERLFRALALLLWDSQALTTRQAALQKILATSATTLPEFVTAYANWWNRFN